MKLIQHRVNSLDDLKKVPLMYGAEIDVRYHEEQLILHHDPFNHHLSDPETLENFLSNCKITGPIILNLKTEGIEAKCISLINKYHIKDWFFLDMSMPFFARFANNLHDYNINKDNLAVRYSEFEAIEYALSFKNKAGWIWIDCFKSLPLNREIYNLIIKANFKICIVSPELQNHSLDKIVDFKKMLVDFKIDAVCTKRPDLWKN